MMRDVEGKAGVEKRIYGEVFSKKEVVNRTFNALRRKKRIRTAAPENKSATQIMF